MNESTASTRERFIEVAIEEMQSHGISGFSIRKVAEIVGVSSGAPYKHFKNKSELVLESIRYINKRWNEVQMRLLEKCEDNPRVRLVELSIAYVEFLCLNPAFQSVLMLNDNSLSPEQLAEKAKVSELTEHIITEYCNSVGMNDTDRKRKTYAVRSFIFGAAFMMNSGFFRQNDMNTDLVRYCIEREFDLA